MHTSIIIIILEIYLSVFPHEKTNYLKNQGYGTHISMKYVTKILHKNEVIAFFNSEPINILEYRKVIN